MIDTAACAEAPSVAMRLGLLLAMISLLSAAGGCKKSEAATVEGRDLFTNACARCHGPDGTGGLPLWEGGPAPRNFRDHANQQALTDEQIRMTIVSGKGSGMPPFGTTFDPKQLNALVAQVRSFDPGK